MKTLRRSTFSGTFAETSAPMAGHHQSAAFWHFACEALTEPYRTILVIERTPSGATIPAAFVRHRPGSFRSDHFGLSLASTPSTTERYAAAA
jgi:hypothetical protein